MLAEFMDEEAELSGSEAGSDEDLDVDERQVGSSLPSAISSLPQLTPLIPISIISPCLTAQTRLT